MVELLSGDTAVEGNVSGDDVRRFDFGEQVLPLLGQMLRRLCERLLRAKGRASFGTAGGALEAAEHLTEMVGLEARWEDIR